MNELFFVLFAGIAVSYGWGMRGTIIGGEKGAMVPGALMGLALSAFSGCEYFYNNPLILAGVGAVTMFCGGNMTYADTLWLTMKEKNPPHFAKNMFSLFLRGGLWFSLFGGYTSLFISSASGFYKLWQILLFFGLLPVFAVVFFFIFNKPYDKEKNIFPKIYFSVNRKETWGGLLGMFLEIVIFSLIFADWSTLAFSLGTFLAGGIGWIIAQFMQIAALLPNKKNKLLFDKINRKGYVDAWKIMECVLGFSGGALSAVAFILTKPLFAEKLALIDKNGLYAFINDDKIPFFVLTVLLALDLLKYTDKTESKLQKNYSKIFGLLEFPLYGTVPYLLFILCGQNIALYCATTLVVLVLFEEITEKCIDNNLSYAFLVALCVVMVLFRSFDMLLTVISSHPVIAVLLYTVLYEVFYYVMILIQRGKLELQNAEKSVHIYFTFACLATIIMSIIIF